MAFDQARATNILDAVNGVASFVPPTLPMRCRLMTANGSATSPGTQLGTGAGGGSGAGYTAGGTTVAYAAAAAGADAASATLRWDNMPACTVVGVEVWDSAGTPKRWKYAPLTTPQPLAAGNAFELPAASFTDSLV